MHLIGPGLIRTGLALREVTRHRCNHPRLAIGCIEPEPCFRSSHALESRGAEIGRRSVVGQMHG